jgi:mannan endo-1,4-beta-mannosidase
MRAQFARTFAMAAVGLALVSSCAAVRSAAGEIPRPAAKAAIDTAPAHASLPAKSASYLGAYEAKNPNSYSAMKTFGRTAGRKPNIALYYSGWGQGFESSFATAAWSNGAVVDVDMDPTGVSLKSIANGKYDTPYLTNFATAVRTFRHPVIISFGHEMNGQWYSWGYKHTSPRVFVGAWRHIVVLFRKVGADNVTWMWTVNWITRDEGNIRDWWPGSAYVTWTAIDGYYYEPSDTFQTKFGHTIAKIRKLSKKPILIGETAIGPVAGQAAKMSNLFGGIRQYGLLGFIWYDESSLTTPSSIYKQDWRLEGHHAADVAFRGAQRRYLTKNLSH